MFVVFGASGHTGSVVASTLLERGKKVRVVARDASKVAALEKAGAEVFADAAEPALPAAEPAHAVKAGEPAHTHHSAAQSTRNGRRTTGRRTTTTGMPSCRACFSDATEVGTPRSR